MKKQIVLMLAALMGIACLSGCGAGQEVVNETMQVESTVATETAQTKTTATTEEQNTNTPTILVVSFGTSYNDSRDITIGAIENAIVESFPENEVRRAFTSQIIMDILKERDGLEIDNVEQALDRAVADGVKELLVQPTHLMNGYEYNDVAKTLAEYQDQFDKILLAEPLMMSDADFDAVIKAITEKTASYDDGETAICFMGHGTEAESNAIYAKLQDKLIEAGYENYYVGTVEAAPTLDDVIVALEAKGTYKKVVLEPLMVVAGDHASNDMAGDEEDSWKTILTNEGYEVECILEGLGQIPAIQDIYVAHVQAALDADVRFDGSALLSEESADVENLQNGTYAIEVESSSSMFKVEKAELTVANGEMTAAITLSGTGYTKLYMGTGEQAGAASEEECIAFVEDVDGAYTFTVPVEALDQPIDCAAFSKKKSEWYDRQLTFLGATIGVESATETTTEATENVAAESVAKEDGTYNVEITFAGGSGKSSIASPVKVTISGDSAIATVQWNSPNYDYMLVDGEKYLPVNTEGDSVFEIPVLAWDEEMTVIGDTIAMSKPHEIEYTITFHSDTMQVAE